MLFNTPEEADSLLQVRDNPAVLQLSDVGPNWILAKKKSTLFYSRMIFRTPDWKLGICRFCPANQVPFSFYGNSLVVKKHFNDIHLVKKPSPSTEISLSRFPESMHTLANWSLASNAKPSMLDSKFFSNFLQTFFKEACAYFGHSQFDLKVSAPSSKSVKKRCSSIAEEFRVKLHNIMSHTELVSLSTDGWSTHDTSYLALIANVVSFSGFSSRYLIGFEPYDRGETSGAFHTAAILDCLLNETSVKEQIFPLPRVLVADSCAANIAAFGYSDFFRSGVFVPCSSHLLHNSVLAAINFVPAMSNLVDQVRTFSAFIRNRSKFATMVLETFNSTASNKISKIALLDGPTRWNSVYLMIDRFLLLQPTMKYILDPNMDLAGVFKTRTGRVRYSDNPLSDYCRFKSLYQFLCNESVIRELTDVNKILQAVYKQSNHLQSELGNIGFVWNMVKLISWVLSQEVRSKLALEASLELCTKNLCNHEKLTLSTAFASALLFQLKHRFFVDNTSSIREHSVAAISENPLRDVSEEYPQRKRRAAARGGREGDQFHATAIALVKNNPYTNGQYFSDQVPLIKSTLPPPNLPSTFLFQNISDSTERLRGFIFLACYLDPLVDRSIEPFSGCAKEVADRLACILPSESNRLSSDGEDLDESITTRHLRSLTIKPALPKTLHEQVEHFAGRQHTAPDGPAAFWIKESTQELYSELWRLGFLIVSTPATSANVERVFSIARTMSGFNQYNQDTSTLRDRITARMNADAIEKYLDHTKQRDHMIS